MTAAESRSRWTNGRFPSLRIFPRRPLMPRKSVETYPPFFPGRFPVWHQFWASPADQGTVWAWVSWRLLALSRDSRTIFERKSRDVSDSRSGLIMGEFHI